uniref:Uncharacterized protein n=1 Tax=Parascaris univalens TaxID=6257 RepID=A0A914ZZJ2_PARUN
ILGKQHRELLKRLLPGRQHRCATPVSLLLNNLAYQCLLCRCRKNTNLPYIVRKARLRHRAFVTVNLGNSTRTNQRITLYVTVMCYGRERLHTAVAQRGSSC